MNQTPKEEDLTLAALDRLAPSEARNLEALLADNPALAAEFREMEDTVAAVWQASSPLHSAPAGTLETIREKIRPRKRVSTFQLFAAAGGWAAALTLLVVLLMRSGPDASEARAPTPGTNPTESTRDTPSIIPPKSPDRTSTAELHEKIRRLQARLLADRTSRDRSRNPRIHELRAPGDEAHLHPEARAEALLNLLTSALAVSLARQNEAPATLVLEAGWLESALAALPEDGAIRHRAFPAQNFEQFGLLRSPEGEFYQPDAGILWFPAGDGGGYLGIHAPADLDLTRFTSEQKDEDQGTDPPADTLGPPSGYVVYNEDNENATVIIGNLDSTEAPPTLVASHDDGRTTVPLSGSSHAISTAYLGFATSELDSTLIHSASADAATSLSIFQANPDGSLNLILTEAP